MTKERAFLLPALLAAAIFLPGGPVLADPDICFSASKTFRIHPLPDGPERRDGWAIEGAAFDQCVHRAIAAQNAFLKRYPAERYSLILAATIGCHAPC